MRKRDEHMDGQKKTNESKERMRKEKRKILTNQLPSDKSTDSTDE